MEGERAARTQYCESFLSSLSKGRADKCLAVWQCVPL